MKSERFKFIAVALCSALIVYINLYSQQHDVQFERISIESGLSQSSVLCIYQDNIGFLWFGTYDGLNRYDGYTFKVYKSDPENVNSLSNNHIAHIIEDHQGMLWIGTQSGLNLFDRKLENFICYKNDPNDPTSLGDDYVRYIYEDQSGIIWVGTYGGGLNRFDRENKIFMRYTHDPDDPTSISNNNILSISEDSRGKLWVGTDGGLNCFDRERQTFVRYQHDRSDPTSISHDGIWRIFEDSKANLWIGTWGGGLNLFNREQDCFFRYQHSSQDQSSISDNVIRTIFEDSMGNLWIGTEVGGLNLYIPPPGNARAGKFMHYKTDANDPLSLSSNSVFSIFEDRSGILWIGTNFGGINKYNPAKSRFSHYRSRPNDVNSLNNNSIVYVYEDHQGVIWIGTNGGGLNRFDRKNNRFTHFINDPDDPNSLSNNVVRTICEDRDMMLWIGTDNGLNRYDRNRNKFIRYTWDPEDPSSISYTTIWSLYTDKEGNLWIGTLRGLNRFDYATETFNRFIHEENNPGTLSDNFIWDIQQDTSGIFWIGTDGGGLNRFDAKQETFTHYRYDPLVRGCISNNKILCIYEDCAGDLWFGTPSGLNKINRSTGTFTRYGEKDGLTSDVIQSIEEDDEGNLWISSTKGISKFNPRTGDTKNYYKNDGLQSNEFGVNSSCKLKSGELIFGGINGFNLFHPERVNIESVIPAVAITNFTLFNKPVAAGEVINGRIICRESISVCKALTLSHKDDVFSFEFAALHFASPEDNRYAYIMEGFDKTWNEIDAGRRFATYTNLNGGEYTFRVKASNNDQEWNEEGTAINITITPPFWDTALFRITMGILFVSLAYFLYRLRIRNIEAHRRILELKVEERTHELKQANIKIREKASELQKTNVQLAITKKETDNILQNVQEGFFLLDSHCKIFSQYSSALEIIFCKKNLAHTDFLKFLKNKVPDSEIDLTKSYLEILFSDNVDEFLISDLNPLRTVEIVFESDHAQTTKYLDFNFKKIKSKNSKDIELIVTVRDETQQIQLANQLKAEEARREKLLQLVLSILDVEPGMLNDFTESAKRELEFIDTIMNHRLIEDYQKVLVKVFRAIHLIKGNAKLLHIDYFAELTHVFEDMITAVQEKSRITYKEMHPLREKLQELQTGIEEMDKIIEKLGQILVQKDDKKRPDTRALFRSLENLISSFSSDLGKKIRLSHKNFQHMLIPEKYHLLIKEVLIQLVRNSVAHGIEFPEERKRLNKPPIGRIEISTFTKADAIGFRFRDDGRGLQIEKLKEQAIQSGKWKAEEINGWSEQQVADLIFASGITTSDRVDMAAGRGVGMDSVKHRIEQYKGEIRVHFSHNHFCEFEVILPSAA